MEVTWLHNGLWCTCHRMRADHNIERNRRTVFNPASIGSRGRVHSCYGFLTISQQAVRHWCTCSTQVKSEKLILFQKHCWQHKRDAANILSVSEQIPSFQIFLKLISQNLSTLFEQTYYLSVNNCSENASENISFGTNFLKSKFLEIDITKPEHIIRANTRGQRHGCNQ